MCNKKEFIRHMAFECLPNMKKWPIIWQKLFDAKCFFPC